ncbi:MAG: dihydroxy-acid dehydratase, partial [Planctomycetes bacterium]|nr:dihydroxy-acid dehydratase [Planctomycetota bacterium]
MARRSHAVTQGVERAPHRSLFNAAGFTDEELARPLIGVVSAFSEIVPGHIHLDKIADAAKAGVRMAGGTPILMPAIGVCDGIGMGHSGMKYSLASRELVADSVETMAEGHRLDGLVLIPNCDKIVPGMVMAAARMNIPSIVISGGPMLAGRHRGRGISLTTNFEAVGAFKAGFIDEAELTRIEQSTCPGCGSCSGMFTANSMNCLCEAIGIALPGNGTTPAVYAARTQLAKRAGMKIMELVEKDIKPRDILTPTSLRNALAVDMALGCSSNSVLHLLAIANEAMLEMDLNLINEISNKVPNLCHLAPAGPHHMEDLYMAGGLPAVMKQLADSGFLDTSVLTVTGKTLAENIEGAVPANPEVLRPLATPYSDPGGLALRCGTIA